MINQDEKSRIKEAHKLIEALYKKKPINIITEVTIHFPETSKEYEIAYTLLENFNNLIEGRKPILTNEKRDELQSELYELLIQKTLKEKGLEGFKYIGFNNREEFKKWKFENLKFKQIDEATEKPKSIDEQVINDLQIHFKQSKTFKGINNEVIKQKLGINISDKKLKQLTKKAFKNIKIRGSDNYFLETI